ncbi:DUF1996 domain-containing protein [Actinomadura fibrosa]|uniref:DUF1996 domain-containing protein n=1 Tax=Actinomadura fibrosa TaxID=111802 RepID=A0ABW2XU96_9ACTN|nr:DUF1996 domain-containing protein [Actinomadura fibrosa]
MRDARRTRSALRTRPTLRTAALAAGSGLVLAALPVSGTAASASASASAAQTVTCPSVADRLPAVPARAQAEVDRNLALLDTQIKEANARLVSSAGEGGPNFVQNAILGPLRDKRVATLNRIATAIGRQGTRPEGLDALAACTVSGTPGSASGTPSPTGTAQPGTAQPGTGQPGNGQAGGDARRHPAPEDFIDIRKVPRAPKAARPARGASRGTFTSQCGRNQNGHRNPDNFIVAPGVQNGAHHTHDYVGNLTTDGFSDDESLARGGTTCRRGDKSAYFWPVLRLRSAKDAAQNDQSAADLNIGRIVTPTTVSLQFRGNAAGKVTAMPRFLRIITGDAKSATNGAANARAAWTCTGFTDRVTAAKYPICPRGSRVARVLDFPSCWDGRNTDSANHRTHVVFPAASGACPSGTRPVPQLRMTLTYALNVGRTQIAQGRVYALDSFPEQLHNPVTDHADFENVMPGGLMRRAVQCINRGRRC